MTMVVTILEAEVEETNWEVLKKTYKEETADMPDDIYQTSLIQSKSEPTSWRIMTLWRSLEDLEKMRKSTSVPLAVKIFKQVGALPVLGIWNVAVQNINKKGPLFNSL